MKLNYKLLTFLLMGAIGISLLGGYVQGQQLSATVCCERTINNFACQDVPSEECAVGSRAVPTACESTSYCKQGTCFDSTEGTCTDNTPQLTCNDNGGVFSEEEPLQCGLGCCVLGDQASFVTLVRCKRLSSQLGLETNYRTDIQDEVSCIASVQGQEKGACVFEHEFERSCKFTTKFDCDNGLNVAGSVGEFFPGKLCSAEELNTVCGPSTQTTCSAGKEEVYFKDTCGNVANIYDANKIEDQEYWTNVKSKLESCNPNAANGASDSCGNCNYLQGSFCREADRSNRPNFGEFICADLNCEDTSNGNNYRHGESWCVNSDNKGKETDQESVGSRFYKHICINGEEVVEQCADLRQETCIEDEIVVAEDSFSQAACRVNRWQDCIAQDNEGDCTNTDRRDCAWYPTPPSLRGKMGLSLTNVSNSDDEGICLPEVSPGLQFWAQGDAQSICAQANAQCVVSYEKGFITNTDYTAKQNKECLSDKWKDEHLAILQALGDCGDNVNWAGTAGRDKGYELDRPEGEFAD